MLATATSPHHEKGMQVPAQPEAASGASLETTSGSPIASPELTVSVMSSFGGGVVVTHLFLF